MSIAVTHEDVLHQMLTPGTFADNATHFNWVKETKHFLQFTSTMIWAFPAATFMRWHIRKNKQLRYILQFKELLSVRNNIEKGRFAYDTLLFKENIFSLLKNKSHLANLVCLALLFGDEFIDGIATEHGKKNIQQIFTQQQYNFYLQYRESNGEYELYYEFDICNLLPSEVLNTINIKYGITYQSFYGHLLFLLAEMNRHLNKLHHDIKEEAAQLICRACNKCFDTYKEDITTFNPDYSFNDLREYQKTKDDNIIQVLLTLRAVLLDKKKLNYQSQFAGWGSIVRSMQLYDDMQDIAYDCNFQMNTLDFFARNYFTNEWNWLQQNLENLKQLKGMELAARVSLYMPASVIFTMQYARTIATTKLNWVQCKIQNYLWRKNWLGFNNRLLKEKKFCLSAVMGNTNTSIPQKLHFIQRQVCATDHLLVTEDMRQAHSIDIMLMDDELKKYLFSKIGWQARYQLQCAFVEMPVIVKAALFKKIITQE